MLSSNGIKAVMQEVAPQFEQATAHKVAISYSVAAELKRRIENGEAFDVAILTPAALDDLIKQGKIVRES